MSSWEYESFNTGLTKEKWIDLLKDRSVVEAKHLEVFKRLKDCPDEAATCTQLSIKYGEKKNFYNANSSTLGERIKKLTRCNSPEDNAGAKYWPILYVGKKADGQEGSYVWKLRKELSEALDEIDLKDVPLYSTNNLSEALRKVIVNRPDETISDYVHGNAYYEDNYKAYEELKAVLNTDSFSFGKYSGQNRLSKEGVVWIGFKDKREENPSQFTNGVYVVYLFSADRSCVYLTLAQGVSDMKEDARELYITRSNDIRDKIPCPAGFEKNSDIHLGSNSALAAQYEKYVIFWKRYDPDNMPDNDELERDLHNLINVYGRYESEINGRRNFWLFRHNGSGDDDGIKREAFEKQYALMQYEFGLQRNAQVGKTLKQASRIQFGDILLFAQGQQVFAYGAAIQSRANITELFSDCNDKSLTHSIHQNEVLGFVGRPLYFDYSNDAFDEDTDYPFGQRICVDGWKELDSPVQYGNDWFDDSVVQNSINKVKNGKGEELLRMKTERRTEGGSAMDPFIKQAKELLLRNKNLILQGAPGTGKTYNTAAIAVSIVDPSFDAWNDRIALMERYKKLREKDHLIDFVTFHQSLDYETFIRGIRPVPVQTESGVSAMTYPIVDGVFVKMCERAKQKRNVDIAACIDKFTKDVQDNPIRIRNSSRNGSSWIWTREGSDVFFMKGGHNEKPDPKTDQGTMWPNIEKVKGQAALEDGVFENNWKAQANAIIRHVKEKYGLEGEPSEANNVVIIIDEINRGNISRIFGELITLLESDKRLGSVNGLTVSLPYTEEGDDAFGVPSNLYILGTMNTTDRSTGSIDYALRRRFAFLTVKADEELIKNNSKADEETRNRAANLFNAIRSFLADKNQSRADMDIEDLMVGHSYFMVNTVSELQDSFKHEILPLIWEYQKDGIIGVSSETLEKRIKGWNRILNGEPEREGESEEDI